MKQIKTQCCIAGGGPAGIMLGYLLARAGVEVVVLEKWPDFFRDFRGDTIHPSTMEVLHEAGLLDEFLKLPHNKTRRVTAQIGGTAVTIADLSWLKVRTPYVAFTPQWHFLNFLSKAAKKYPQFHLMMETEVTDLITKKGRVTGVKAKHKGAELEIHADLVVGADGRHSTVREKAKLEVEKLGAPVDVLWFKLFKHASDPHQLSGIVNDGKLLVMIDRGDYWQCAFIIAKGDFEQVKKKGLPAFHQTIMELAPFTEGKVEEIDDWEQVKLLSVTVDRLKTWYTAGLVCIGDAAHAMSPLGGVGINLAIQDAVAAANVLIPAFKEGIPAERDFARIQKRREFPTRVTQRFQIMMQDRVLLPYLHAKGPTRPPFISKLFNWVPILRWLPARFIGIGVRPEHIKYK